MEKKKVKIKYNVVIFTFLILLVSLFWGFLLYANILPLKYILIGIGVFIIWLLIIWFLLFFKRNKKKKKRDVIAYIISGFLIIIMFSIFFYLNKTLNFFEGFGSNKYKEENYVVVVLKDSKYAGIEDLKDKNIGYVPSELNKISDALTELNDKVEIKNVEYEQYDKMFEDLISKKIESLLVEESYLAMLEENNDYTDLIKTIYTITIKTELDDTNSKAVDVTNKPFTIYISGIDNYGAISSVSRSDVNMVVTINPTTKQIFMVSIPRDFYVQLHGTKGYKDKITHAGLYGIDNSVATVEDLLGIEVNYYYRVNFSTLEKVVDAIGGVDAYSKYAFTSSEASGGTYKFAQGYNHMNGKQALSFSRERHNLPAAAGGDRGRGENQQAVIDGIVRKATSASILTKYTSLLSSLKGTFQTNMSDDDILKLIKMQLDDMAKWNITSYSLTGSDGSEYTYSYPHQKLYVMKPDEKTVSEASDKIKQVIEGKTLDSSYSASATDVKTPTTVTPRPSTTTDTTTEVKPTVKPTITLNGESSITLIKGEAYVEKGATATDSKGTKLDVEISGNVDEDTVGTYKITYTAKDSSGNNTSITRTIIVKESTKPIITIKGDKSITIEVGTTYTDEGATATDSTGQIPLEVTPTGSVDTTKKGIYTIIYTATDSNNNSSTATRTVNVIDLAPEDSD